MLATQPHLCLFIYWCGGRVNFYPNWVRSLCRCLSWYGVISFDNHVVSTEQNVVWTFEERLFVCDFLLGPLVPVPFGYRTVDLHGRFGVWRGIGNTLG
jgi:hypothetical protein